ncbi:MAG: tetratricopeptide repeat protein [Cytophagales bacterium]|nr:tetratricopeptide repeat protein [Cytophagales bacterium]
MIRLLLLLTFGSFLGYSQSQEEETLNNKGLELMEKEKYGDALPYFDKLISANPEVTPYRFNRAVTLFNLKQYTRALKDYLFLEKFDSEEPEYPFQIGNIYEHLDSLKKAEHYYSKAIEIEDEYYLYYFKRGTVRLKQSQWSTAVTDFNRVLELDPEHHNTLHNRGIAYYRAGFKEKGCEDWCQALLKGNTKSAEHLQKNCKVYPKPCLLSK